MQGDPEAAFTGQSLPIRGAWIEIKTATSKQSKTKSLPIRGAWIEISPPNHANTAAAGRSPSGERGLKYIVGVANAAHGDGRSPSGERGLKYPRTVERQHLAGSLPIRGAWIEINLIALWCSGLSSLPIRGAWIEIHTPITTKTTP